MLGCLKCKRQKIASISEVMEKLEPYYIAGRNVKWCCYFRKSDSFSKFYT